MTQKINLTDFDAVAFDVEGTLADTIPSHMAALTQALQRHGYHHITPEQVALSPTYGSTTNAIHGGLLHATGTIREKGDYDTHPEVVALTATKNLFFEKLVAEGFEEQPGATDLVKAIARQFPGKVALVTAAPYNHIYPFIERYQLNKVIAEEHIIVAETIHEFGLQQKPSPDPYKLAIKRLNASRLLVFEDSVPGITAAKLAGATVIALEFHEHNAKLFASMATPPDVIAGSYEEVRAMLGL